MNLRLSHLVLAVCLHVGSASALGAQSTAPRVHLVPQIGVGAELNEELTGSSYETEFAAWVLGAQLELVSGSHWTPLIGFQHWRLEEEVCDAAACDDLGWSFNAGVLRSFVATSILRPFGGISIGLRRVQRTDRYVQGHAGIDFTPRQSPLTFRIEVRYQDALDSGPSLFLLNTGIRVAIPSP